MKGVKKEEHMWKKRRINRNCRVGRWREEKRSKDREEGEVGL